MCKVPTSPVLDRTVMFHSFRDLSRDSYSMPVLDIVRPIAVAILKVNTKIFDWLAAKFIASGWSVKAMHRLIVASAAPVTIFVAPGPTLVVMAHVCRRLVIRANATAE